MGNQILGGRPLERSHAYSMRYGLDLVEECWCPHVPFHNWPNYLHLVHSLGRFLDYLLHHDRNEPRRGGL